LQLARALHNAPLIASILNNLGNVLSTQEQPPWPEVLRVYQESAAVARQAHHPALVARALTHAAMAATQDKQYGEARALLGEALEHVRKVTPTHDTVYDVINIGLSYDRLRPEVAEADHTLLLLAAEVFTNAVQMAESLGDARAMSYALGHLGHLYETEHRYQEALQLTRRAVVAAQQAQAPESLYLWQWQTGRLLAALNENDAALTAYGRAIDTVQSSVQPSRRVMEDHRRRSVKRWDHCTLPALICSYAALQLGRSGGKIPRQICRPRAKL
jgi:tetratricopeptide (TPR) repeat protein